MTNYKSPRGFALLSPERRAQISSKGGKSVPAEKRTYSIDKSKASESGKIGGAFSRKRAVTDRGGEE